MGPILLKKSVNAGAPIFLASLVRFLNKDAEDLIGRRRSDVDRCKWNCEAINSRFQMSIRFKLICAAPRLGTFSTESANNGLKHRSNHAFNQLPYYVSGSRVPNSRFLDRNFHSAAYAICCEH